MTFDLNSIANDRWRGVLSLRSQLRALGDDVLSAPVATWNRASDALHAARVRALQDPDLLHSLRDAVPHVTDPADRQFLYETIAPLNAPAAESVAELLKDPLVALRADQFTAAAAVYLAEDPAVAPEDLYSWDDEVYPPDEPMRDLSRIGGSPTRDAGAELPDVPFLMQIDFQGMRVGAIEQEFILQTLDDNGAPANGLLQVFHSTMGDSRTDPHLAGGGAIVRYMTEAELADRIPVDPRASCTVYPPSRMMATYGLSFRMAPAVDDHAAEAVEDLQRIADIWARGGAHTAAFESSVDPFTAAELPVTRLFGVQAYDFETDTEDLEVLHRDLPITEDDSHVLLLNMTAEHSFDTVFGDGGRLEIWMRESDLRAARFESVVSFLRSL